MVARAQVLLVFLELVQMARVQVHLLQPLVVVVLVHHALAVEVRVRVLVSSVVRKAHQGLALHFKLAAVRDAVLEVFVVD